MLRNKFRNERKGRALSNKGRALNNKGFTLVEISVVMMISGLLFVAGVQIYEIYSKGRGKTGTYETMERFNNAMNTFYSFQKRYPCPADPSLSAGDPLAGIENCIPLTPIGGCSGGICKTTGRDADGNGTPDNILLGTIPYKTLTLGRNDLNPYDGIIKDDIALCNAAFIAAAPLPVNCPVGMGAMLKHESSINDLGSMDSLDAWGNQMSYTVTSRLTSNAVGVFDISYGALTVQTEVGAQLSDPAGSVMWVLVSHGKDGNGAYTYDGIQKPCGTVSKDIENCNNNNVFINGITSLVSGTNYFDDMTYFSTSRLSSLWTNAQTNAVAGSDETIDIANRNIGNVGVGIPLGAVPSQRLEVANTIKAANVMSTKICNSAGADCFSQGSFGGSPGQLCGAPTVPNTIKVMQKIAGGSIGCVDVPMVPAVAAQTCPAGQAMKGVNNLGVIICGVP